MITCPLDELGAPVDGAECPPDGPSGDPSGWGAELLLVQHPGLAAVRFSCRCVDCHRQILTAKFGAELADAWLAVRGELADPADANR